jgi:hypothetical protein
MAGLLGTEAADRLSKLCGMLGSAHDGERAAAARLADEFVKKLGLRWNDVINPAVESVPLPPPKCGWRGHLAVCAMRSAFLNTRERDFVLSLSESIKRREPTERQQQWLADIYGRLRGSAE